MTANLAVVDSASGSKVAPHDRPFILALRLGENLFEGILACAVAANLKSASLSGLGALDDVTLAYYNLETKSYQTKVFHGTYELISLHGNIATLDGKPFIHLHAAISDDQYQVFGGHVMDATVGPSAEITITPLIADIHRQYDERTGLKLMCPLLSV